MARPRRRVLAGILALPGGPILFRADVLHRADDEIAARERRILKLFTSSEIGHGG